MNTTKGSALCYSQSILALSFVAGGICVARLRRPAASSSELWRAVLESTDDGILVVSNRRRIVAHNSRFAELWRIPQGLLDAGDDEALLTYVAGQLRHPKNIPQ